ncbi:MAG: PKD domain-containing protein [Chloroflexia bacterium]
MNVRRRLLHRLASLLFLALLVALAAPPWAYSGGEIVLKVKETAQVGESVTFEVVLTTPGEVHWDFGDGTTATGLLVSHVYTAAGEYRVVVTVSYPTTPPTGDRKEFRIRVMSTGNQPPKAVAAASPRQTIAGQPIAFDASASTDPDGQISRYLWNFGDGTVSPGMQVEHVYAQAGTYAVLLTVTDNGEMDATASLVVTVTAVPAELLPGVKRVLPAPAGEPPVIEPLVLLDMGVFDYEPERFPYREYKTPALPTPFRGVASTPAYWLLVDPAEFEYPAGPEVQLLERITVRSTHLLPRAHTSWGLVTLVINGSVVEMPVSITLRGPEKDISKEVWALYEEILTYLTERGERGAMAYSPRYPNGADVALGLITEYILTDGYNGKMSRGDFVTKVAEMLMGRDENGDGIAGFTENDRALGVKVGK